MCANPDNWTNILEKIFPEMLVLASRPLRCCSFQNILTKPILSQINTLACFKRCATALLSWLDCGLTAARHLASPADILSGSSRNHSSPHERLLQPVATSVQANWPITGRLPFFVKRDFDLKFISRVHVNMRTSLRSSVLLEILYSGVKCPSERSYNPIRGEAEGCFISLSTGFGKSLIYQHGK